MRSWFKLPSHHLTQLPTESNKQRTVTGVASLQHGVVLSSPGSMHSTTHETVELEQGGNGEGLPPDELFFTLTFPQRLGHLGKIQNTGSTISPVHPDTLADNLNPPVWTPITESITTVTGEQAKVLGRGLLGVMVAVHSTKHLFWLIIGFDLLAKQGAVEDVHVHGTHTA